jgi:leucine dehydrogenase
VIQLEKLAEFDNHAIVSRITDAATGLRGYIAIHDTTLGPAVGGTRFWHYKNEEEALRDALRLSRAMTYKCAIAGVPYGGGKAVLMAPTADAKKSEAYLAAYARELQFFAGRFFTGEDVGITERDIEVLASHSGSIIGRPAIGGLPARYAALSVFRGIETAAREVFGFPSLLRKSVAIKGLGNVGMELAGLLHEAGVELTAADIDEKRVREAKRRFPGIHIVSSARIHKESVDVYAPCALGSEFTNVTARQVRAKIICGAANNQLENARIGTLLARRGILYIPDYAANAGGLISVVDELDVEGYSEKRVLNRVDGMRSIISRIIGDARQRKLPTSAVADEIVQERLRSHRS